MVVAKLSKIRKKLEKQLEALKKKHNYKNDNQINAKQLLQLCNIYEKKIYNAFNEDFPKNSMDQLWGAIEAVLKSITKTILPYTPISIILVLVSVSILNSILIMILV